MIDNSQALNFSRSIIRFYDPYSRLSLRVDVEDAIGTFPQVNSSFAEVDATSILDAIYKRCQLQSLEMRIEQIYLSLPYYSRPIIDYWIQQIKKLPQQLLEYVKQNCKISEQPFIEVHLLPLNQSVGFNKQKREIGNHLNYIKQEVDTKQLYFLRRVCKDHNMKFDQYYCLKTLAYFGADLSRIDKRFYKKYHILRQLMYINDSISGVLQPSQSNSSPSFQSKICIVGLNITSLLLASKLISLGFKVCLVERNPQVINCWKKGLIPDLLKQGLYLTNQFENKKLQELIRKHAHITIQIQSWKNEITKCFQAWNTRQHVSQSFDSSLMHEKDENQDDEKQHIESVTNIEQIYILLLEQIIQDLPMNKNKVFWMQMQYRIEHINNNQLRYKNKYKGIQKIDIQVLKAFHQRLLMFCKLKDIQSSTVKDVYSLFASFNSNEDDGKISLPFYVSLIKSYSLSSKATTSIFQQQKFENTMNFIFLSAEYQPVSRSWQVRIEDNETKQVTVEKFDYLIYGDDEKIYESLGEGNSKALQGVLGQTLDETPLFTSLTMYSHVFCLYKLTQKGGFRNIDIKNEDQQICTYNCSLGIIHFYLIEKGLSVISCLIVNEGYKGMEKQEIYKEIYHILANMLKKGVGIASCGDQWTKYVEISRYCKVKNERIQEKLLMCKEKSKLFFSIPIISESKSLLLSRILVNNKIILKIFQSERYACQQKNQNLPAEQLSAMIVQERKMTPQDIQPIREQEKIQCIDLFGFNCSFIRNYLDYLQQCRNSISNSMKKIFKGEAEIDTRCQKIPYFQDSAFPLSIPTAQIPSFCITDFGLPRFENNIAYFDHYSAFYEGDSFIFENKKSLMVSLCIRHEGQPFYFIIEQIDQLTKLVFFHVDFEVLCSMIGKSMKKRGLEITPKTGETNFQSMYTKQIALKNYLRDQLKNYPSNQFCQICTRLLEESLSFLTLNEVTFTEIRGPKKLKNIIEIQPQNILMYIVETGDEYVRYYCELLGLRNYKLSDIFFGKINLEYLLEQLKGNLCLDPNRIVIDEENQQELTRILSQSLQKFQADYKIRKFPFKIEKNNTKKTITFTRNFLPFKEKDLIESYFYSYSPSFSEIDFYPTTAEKNSSQIRLKTLLRLYIDSNKDSLGKLLNAIHSLIKEEINVFVQLINLHSSTKKGEKQLFSYIKMTRLKEKMAVDSSQFRLMKQRLMLLNDEQQESLTKEENELLQEMILEGEFVLFDDNDFIILQ